MPPVPTRHQLVPGAQGVFTGCIHEIHMSVHITWLFRGATTINQSEHIATVLHGLFSNYGPLLVKHLVRHLVTHFGVPEWDPNLGNYTHAVTQPT